MICICLRWHTDDSIIACIPVETDSHPSCLEKSLRRALVFPRLRIGSTLRLAEVNIICHRYMEPYTKKELDEDDELGVCIGHLGFRRCTLCQVCVGNYGQMWIRLVSNESLFWVGLADWYLILCDLKSKEYICHSSTRPS